MQEQPARTVDAVVRERCEERRAGLVGRRRRRVDAAERALRACFERHGEAALTDAERELLVLERQFGEPDPVARVAAADALLPVVPTFLLDAEWHGGDPVDRRLRYLLAWRLAHRLVHEPGCAGLDLTHALAAVDEAELLARRSMRRDRADEPHRERQRPRPPIDQGIDLERPPLRRPFPGR